MRRPSAVPVRQTALNPGEVVLCPFGVRCRRGRVELEPGAADVHPLLLILLEGTADRGVVEGGVTSGHLRTGVPEKLLHNVLRHPRIDQPGAVGYLPWILKCACW